jgi:hypothetical protein
MAGDSSNLEQACGFDLEAPDDDLYNDTFNVDMKIMQRDWWKAEGDIRVVRVH